MKKQLMIAVGVASLSLSVSLPSLGEVTQKYDEFSGKTTISVIPNSSWDGKTPRLFLNKSYQGERITEVSASISFSVIAPIKSYNSCAKGVTGVIVDGERLIPNDENQRSSRWTKIEALGRQNRELRGYVKLWRRYSAENFQKLVKASEIKYQLCGDPDKVFTLSPEEKEDLKKFASIVLPPNLVDQPN